jgi:hypothetical protein
LNVLKIKMTFAQRTYFYRIIYFINMKNKTFIYFKGKFVSSLWVGNINITR